MLITRYVMHRACATFCDFSPLLLLLSVHNKLILIAAVRCLQLGKLCIFPLYLHFQSVRLDCVIFSVRLMICVVTTTSNGQTRPIQKFLNRPIAVESNRYGRFESNLEASQVPNFSVLVKKQLNDKV